MKTITGTISFVGGIITFILLMYALIGKFDNLDGDDLYDILVWTGFFIVCVCAIHYTLATKFWTSKISVIESLERENEIIKKQIEKRELLVRLQNLEQK